MTRKQFREWLNNRFPITTDKHSNGVYGNCKRALGDYLWFSDREQFNIAYSDYLTNPKEFLERLRV